MTRDCGQYRDDQRLWIVQGMTADLWGGGGSGYLNLTDTRSHFRVVVLSSYLFLYPAARCLPGFCNGARHDSWVPSAHEREALALCDWSGGFCHKNGICHVSQVPRLTIQK
ncbi:unnamed protein product, partial [Staurois parvus]